MNAKDRTFEISGVKFNLPKIPPLQGWDICELFREAVGSAGALDTPDINPDMTSAEQKRNIAKAIIKLLMALPRKQIRELRDMLFEHVQFKLKEQPSFITLSGAEEMAFENLNPFSIYEVLGRAFIVNFTDAFTETMSHLGIDVAMVMDTPQSEPGQSPSS